MAHKLFTKEEKNAIRHKVLGMDSEITDIRKRVKRLEYIVYTYMIINIPKLAKDLIELFTSI